MLSVQSPSPAMTSNEKAPRHRPANLMPPSPRPLSTPGLPMHSPRLMTPTSSMRPTSELLGSANKLPTRDVEALDQWFANFQIYEATLEEMAAASTEPKFKEELSTIEHWFKILSEPERTATLYTLLQQSSQMQIRFLIAVLQQMIKSDANPPPTASIDGQIKGKATRNARPPSLNLPDPSTSLPSAVESASLRSAEPSANAPKSVAQELLVSAPADESWASMVKTPSTPMFGAAKSQKQEQPTNQFNGGFTNPAMGLQGIPGNPFNNLGMIGAMGLSPEAQMLAVQMMMGGYVQPGQMQMPHPQPHRQPTGSNTNNNRQSRQPGNNWRAPASARFPTSALKSGGLKSSGLKSSGLKSSGLKSSGLKSANSTGSAATPREEDFDPEMLKDIPAWLKTFRLHKYTSCFEGLTWQEMVSLDDAALEAKGVVTLGARRRLLRTFEMVRIKMGLQSAPAADASTPSATDAATPTAPKTAVDPPSSSSPSPTVPPLSATV
ncbi:hypothetical protein PC9H_007766 [Pleurotus ostreatus]|uniref:SAM domain-containing protein n=1 Tax=Pleurotus ostreatus TaxID=5322 RepID=A0A8H6ZRQ0_PLEOS|nr:uncharacterized protein PC9H_007766 [Pleurotus ostreatus]KAF7428542.1 hypothetical protein PC9H_007766 [Pleurotus ostreatus]KAJ8696698.1 Flap-structured DNA-binding and RNA-binding protein [Pleurotus ostreatus]